MAVVGFDTGDTAYWDYADMNVESRFIGFPFTISGSGTATVDNISARLKESASANQHSLIAVVLDASGNLLANGSSACVSTIGLTYAWVDFTFSTAPSLTLGTAYYFGLLTGPGSGSLHLRGSTTSGNCPGIPYNSVTQCQMVRDSAITNPCSTPDSAYSLSNQPGMYSGALHLDYTEAGAGGGGITAGTLGLLGVGI